MPIHDWTRVPAGLFHHFHQDWSIEIAREPNRGLLPRGVSALVEQRSGPREADILTIERRDAAFQSQLEHGGVATLEHPAARIVRTTNSENYARRANRIVLKHHLGQIVAVIEIVSPGNKGSRIALREFVDMAVGFVEAGVHVLIVDLFPPTPRDPVGIHKLIWDEFLEEEFVLPAGKDRILASYKAGNSQTAFVEPLAVGDILMEMPLFLSSEIHIKVPLESSNSATWDASPEYLRTAVESGVLPPRSR